MSVSDNRRENLRALVRQWDGPSALAGKLGYKNPSFIVQMAGPNPSRGVTEKTARFIESTLGLPEDWLDGAHRGVQADAHPLSVDASSIASFLKAVGKGCEELGAQLTPNKFADVVAYVYAEATERKRAVTADEIKRLIQLAR